MIKLRILFLCKKKDYYSNLCKNFLKKKFHEVKIIETNRKKKILFSLNWKGDLILLFRSKIILQEKIINKARIACVNFHPSTPRYRGMGGVNYALYKKDKYFGCTAHLITDNNIDSGKILNVKKFKITKNMTLKSLLNKTHKNLYQQFKNVVPNLINMNKINILIKQSKKEKWSKIYNNKKKLDKFYEVSLNNRNLKDKIRATYINDKFCPYYFSKNRKIKLTKNKIKQVINI